MKISIKSDFDAAVQAAELPIRKAAFKTAQIIDSLADIPALLSHHGLHFEKIHGLIHPDTHEQLHSIRITRGVRAMVCLDDDPTVVLISLHVEHDKAYRKS